MKTFFKNKVLATPYQTAETLVMDFIRYVENMLVYRDQLYIALSGGSTPQIMFDIIVKEYAEALPWDKLLFFWVDERFVPESDDQSNFGWAQKILFSKVPIPRANLHPIHGGDDPLNEVIRYTGDILSHVPCQHNIPVFDLILLGLGDDGHTASIFPGQLDLFEMAAICAISKHPESHQKRMTLTGKVLNNASEVVFLVTGNQKATTIKAIWENKAEAMLFPAKKINPVQGKLAWYIDIEAATGIEVK